MRRGGEQQFSQEGEEAATILQEEKGGIHAHVVRELQLPVQLIDGNEAPFLVVAQECRRLDVFLQTWVQRIVTRDPLDW